MAKALQQTIPGPRGLPILGPGIRVSRDPLKFFEELHAEFGDLSYHRSFGMDFFLIFSPENIEHVLVKNSKNYIKDRFLRSWSRVFGQGLLTAEGEEWKRQRRMIQPAFSRERVESYTQAMVDCTERSLSSWQSGSTVSIDRQMMALTLDIVVKTILGGSIKDDTPKVAHAFAQCSQYFEKTILPIGFFIANLPTWSGWQYRQGVRTLDSIVSRIIAEKRTLVQTSTERSQDLLSTLMHLQDEDGTKLSDSLMRDEVMTLFLAGHETTALTLTYTLHLLAKHPEIQTRAKAEIKTQLGARLSPRLADIQALTYLNQILTESMRLYPPAYVIAREALKADQFGAYSVPAKSNVMIPTWAIHRSARWYESPTRFMPERWTPEFRASLPRPAYMPFGYGPRMCVGFQFATQEALLILATILRRFSLVSQMETELRVKPSITARPRDPVLIKVVED